MGYGHQGDCRRPKKIKNNLHDKRPHILLELIKYYI